MNYLEILEGVLKMRSSYLPNVFDIYLVNVKTIRQIVQIFLAFSEKLNFKTIFQSEDFPKKTVLPPQKKFFL